MLLLDSSTEPLEKSFDLRFVVCSLLAAISEALDYDTLNFNLSTSGVFIDFAEHRLRSSAHPPTTEKSIDFCFVGRRMAAISEALDYDTLNFNLSNCRAFIEFAQMREPPDDLTLPGPPLG